MSGKDYGAGDCKWDKDNLFQHIRYCDLAQDPLQLSEIKQNEICDPDELTKYEMDPNKIITKQDNTFAPGFGSNWVYTKNLRAGRGVK